MNIGQITQSEEEKNFPRRSGLVPEYSGGTARLQSDIGRLLLLVLMVLAGIFGVFYNTHINKPETVIRHSIEIGRSRSYKSSLEGSMSLGGNRLATYRIRYEYHPKHGLRTLLDESTGEIPYDSAQALELLGGAVDLAEYDKEDMYGHGTRHFTGSFTEYTESDSTAYAFEYWVDMRKQLPVRLDVARVERNAAIGDDGDAVSRETFFSIRYHNWEK